MFLKSKSDIEKANQIMSSKGTKFEQSEIKTLKDHINGLKGFFDGDGNNQSLLKLSAQSGNTPVEVKKVIEKPQKKDEISTENN